MLTVKSMKEPHSISSFPDQKVRFSITGLRFGDHGPYNLNCSGAETIGISGISGIGKTLFLRALADLDSHSGQISLDGQECSDFSAPVWRSRVALIPAESRWWYENVKSHMMTGGDHEELVLLLEALGFEDDVLNWQVSRLSTGEKQRLSVVRVLVRKPSVLLLDEVGSSLDRENCELLETAVKNFQKRFGSPVLWVSHDREQIQRICDRLVVIHQNRLEERQLSEKEWN